MALHYAETRHAVQIARRVDITTTERNTGYIADSESLQSAPLGVAYTDSMSGSRQNLTMQTTTINAMENRAITPADQPPPYVDKDRSIEVGRYALFDLQGTAGAYKPPIYIPFAKEPGPPSYVVNAGEGGSGIRRCPIIVTIVVIAILLIVGTIVIVLAVNSESNRRSPCMGNTY